MYEVLSAILCHAYRRTPAGDYDVRGAGVNDLEAAFPVVAPMGALVTLARVDRDPVSAGEAVTTTVVLHRPNGGWREIGMHSFLETPPDGGRSSIAITVAVDLQMVLEEPGLHTLEVSLSQGVAPLRLPLQVDAI